VLRAPALIRKWRHSFDWQIRLARLDEGSDVNLGRFAYQARLGGAEYERPADWRRALRELRSVVKWMAQERRPFGAAAVGFLGLFCGRSTRRRRSLGGSSLWPERKKAFVNWLVVPLAVSSDRSVADS